MDDAKRNFLKAVSTRLHSLRDGMCSPEDFKSDLLEDYGDIVISDEHMALDTQLPKASPGKVVMFQCTCKLDGKKYVVRFLTQNPDKKDSKYAEMAKKGDIITWVIDPRKNEGKGAYLGRIHNGEWFPTFERAYSKLPHVALKDAPMMAAASVGAGVV